MINLTRNQIVIAFVCAPTLTTACRVIGSFTEDLTVGRAVCIGDAIAIPFQFWWNLYYDGLIQSVGKMRPFKLILIQTA